MRVQDPVAFNTRKEKILRHARHLFADEGFAGTSLDKIAHASGIQKTSLYHYFANKEEILKDLLRQEGERWKERFKTYESGRDLRETLVLAGAAFLKEMRNPASREFFMMLHHEAHKNPEIRKTWKETPVCDRERLHALLAKYLSGRLTHTQIAMFAIQFMGALVHYVILYGQQHRAVNSEPFDEHAYVQQLADIFSRGVTS